MITIDSSVWIDYFRGARTLQTNAVDTLFDDSSNDVIVLDVVLIEVLRGFRQPRERAMADRLLSALPIVTAGGADVARAAAHMYRQLRGVGVAVRSNIDLLVGAWCIRERCALIHNDRNFASMQLHYGLITHRASP
jgi:predicted nucleic acid-binding protein